MKNKKYLENISEQDIPQEKMKHPIIFSQFVPNQEKYEEVFGDYNSINDVWNELYIFIYHTKAENRRSVLFGPIEAQIKPIKFLGFPTNKAGISTALSQFIELEEPKELQEDSTHQEVKDEWHKHIVAGETPWVKGKQKAIIAQNDLNRVLNMLSKYIPDMNGDFVEVKTMNEIYDMLYVT